jgi:hypothetical protein
MIALLLTLILFVLVLSSPLARQTLGVITLVVLIVALYIGTRNQPTNAAERLECRGNNDPRGCRVILGPYESGPRPYDDVPRPYFEQPKPPVTAPAKPSRPYIQR